MSDDHLPNLVATDTFLVLSRGLIAPSLNTVSALVAALSHIEWRTDPKKVLMCYYGAQTTSCMNTISN